MIELQNLCFSYDNSTEVLKNIDISFEKGKFYTILGPNGSGKTTLLKTIDKLIDSYSGRISILDEDIKNMKAKTLAKLVAAVPQYTAVEFEFSAYDIVMMGRTPYLSRFSDVTDGDKAVVEKAMKDTNTWHLRSKGINELSGGECQRVIVARAIAQHTDIILLDEPISHLDIHHQIDILNKIRTMNKVNNKTIIAVLHDLNIAAAYSDYIILMHNGKIHSMGLPEEILTLEAVKEVYGLDVHIINDPKTDRPYIIPDYEF